VGACRLRGEAGVDGLVTDEGFGVLESGQQPAGDEVVPPLGEGSIDLSKQVAVPLVDKAAGVAERRRVTMGSRQ